MIDDGASTLELLATARACLDGLERSVKTRRRSDKASDHLTELFLAVEHVGRRLRLIEWNESVVTEDEEDEDQAFESRREVSLHELMSMSDDVEDDAELGDDVTVLRRRIQELECRCTDMFKAVIRYTTRGCTTAEQVRNKWLALVRRVDPEALRDIGMTQTAVARALGERRATTSAREKREFEAPLKLNGSRGYLGGGLRSEQNRKNCAKAQRGNRNRATGHAASQGGEFQEQRRTSAGGQQRRSKHKTAHP